MKTRNARLWSSSVVYTSAFFLGVAFLPVAAFFAFAPGLAATGALVLVTRPDLVLPRTVAGFSSTAGAFENVNL